MLTTAPLSLYAIPVPNKKEHGLGRPTVMAFSRQTIVNAVFLLAECKVAVKYRPLNKVFNERDFRDTSECAVSMMRSANPIVLVHPLGRGWRFIKLIMEDFMSNTLSVFQFESCSVRTLGDLLNPLFVSLDVCNALGYKRARDAVAQHVDPEDIIKQSIDTDGGKQEVNCVNESGLYALIFGSKLESAKRFKKWVTTEVLPQIRKTGQFTQCAALPPINIPITPEQQYYVRMAAAKASYGDSRGYKHVYTEIYKHFRVARYTDIPYARFDEAIKFIESIELPDHIKHETAKYQKEQRLQAEKTLVPTALETTTTSTDIVHVPAPIGAVGTQIYITESELDAIHRSVYYTLYFRETLQAVYKALQSLGSPFASKMYDAMNEPFFGIERLKTLLERNGIDCNKPN